MLILIPFLKVKFHIHGVYNNKCPQILPRYFISYNFKYHSSIHEHHTRSKNKIHHNKTRTNIAGKSLRHTTSKICINNTSPNIINKIHTRSYIGYINYTKIIFKMTVKI